MKRLTIAAALCLAAFAAQAQDEAANETRFRVGAAAVFADYKGDPSFPIEDSGLGVDFYAQANLSRSFAVELGYFNSGGFEQDLEPGSSEGPVEIRFGGFDVAALWYLPLFRDSDTDIDLFLKAGLYDFDIDITVVEGNSKVPGSLGHSTGVLLGGGFVLNVSENVGVRAVFDWYDVDNAELWALGLGLEYQF
ncbi:MAG: outer membrane beta-barrel protein [Gammaproteobacteria bacterium]